MKLIDLDCSMIVSWILHGLRVLIDRIGTSTPALSQFHHHRDTTRVHAAKIDLPLIMYW